MDRWQRLWLRRVKALRSLERKTRYGLGIAIQRAAGEISLSFLVKHETFRCVRLDRISIVFYEPLSPGEARDVQVCISR